MSNTALPLPLVEIKPWDVVTICGMRRTGKSTLARYLLKKLPQVLVFDTMEEYSEFPHRYIPRTDRPEELDQVAAKVWKKGNITLAVDECELYLPNKTFIPPNIFKVITRGGHRKVGLWCITRRIADFNKTAFGLSEHIFLFRHFGVADIKYLQEFIPEAEKLRDLPDYHFWHYHRGQVTVFSPVPEQKF